MTTADHKPHGQPSLRERAALAVTPFRVGHVIVLDDEACSIRDEEGHRFDVSRRLVPPLVYEHLQVGSRVQFRENAFHSVAELKL